MTDADPKEGPQTFLSRWSRRKLESSRADASPAVGAVPSGAVAHPATEGDPSTVPATPAVAPMPSLDALTFDSDFTAFMRPEVDPSLKRAALRTLLHDPRFNVMDGLDVYIDDYTKPAPIDPSLARQMVHARYIFTPPATRVNAEGHVEDVPVRDIAETEAPVVEDPVEGAAGGETLPVTEQVVSQEMSQVRFEIDAGRPPVVSSLDDSARPASGTGVPSLPRDRAA